LGGGWVVWDSKYRQGFRLWASRENESRSWPGGTDYAKIGPNYGPALLVHGEAKRHGYDQVLWLFGPDYQITEAGSSNVFVIRRSPQGTLQMITAPLGDKTILAGVTRQSIIDLSQERFVTDKGFSVEGAGHQNIEALEVVERYYTMTELLSDLNDGHLLSTFVVGTAAFVTAVSHIYFRGQEININTETTHHASLLRQWLHDIMYGKVSSEWAEIIEEASQG
ncbi:aminotransferase, partial [Pyrenochaeta sp. MPI-SDFR-AT-0127]